MTELGKEAYKLGAQPGAGDAPGRQFVGAIKLGSLEVGFGPLGTC